MQDNIEAGTGYEGTDEYTPAGAEPGSIDKGALNVSVDGPAHAAIHMYQWRAESRMFTAEMSAPDRLALRLFSYPAWRVEVNGHEVQPASTETGQLLVPVGAGMNRVQINFIRTWDRRVGGWTSVVAVVFLALLRFRRHLIRPTLVAFPQP